MKRYILPLTLIIIGSLLLFYGWYQVQNYSNQPWTHFTGMCTTNETPYGCPKEAAETNKRLSETPEAFVNSLWAMGVLVGLVVLPSGLAIGIYRLIRSRRHSTKPVLATKAKS